MELRDYLRLLRRRWLTIVVVVLACAAGAAVVTVLSPRTYRATTQILVASPQAGGPAGTGVTSSENGGVQSSLAPLVGSFATLVGTPPSVAAATTAAGLPGSGVAISASSNAANAVLTVDVDAAAPATAEAVAAAFVKSFPGVLVRLNQVPDRSSLSFTVLTPAALPTSAFRPDPVRNGVIGLGLGLVLGLAVAVAREALDRRVRDSRGLEERLGLPVLGVVPYEYGDVDLTALSYPDSRRTESYRKVRTNLLFTGPEGMARSIAITSAVAGEGKTTLAANLAVVCAQAGQRVALVDADLRKPAMHVMLDLANGTGLSSVLAGEANLDDVIQAHATGVDVITSGPSPRDPSALLESPAFRKLVNELELSHDVVIVDTTPALAVSDAAQVCAACTAAVLVSRLRSTTYDSVKRACTTLERVRTPALGVVAVGHDEDPDAGYRYYYAPSAGETSARRGGGSRRKGAAEPVDGEGWRRADSS